METKRALIGNWVQGCKGVPTIIMPATYTEREERTKKNGFTVTTPFFSSGIVSKSVLLKAESILHVLYIDYGQRGAKRIFLLTIGQLIIMAIVLDVFPNHEVYIYIIYRCVYDITKIHIFCISYVNANF